MFEETINNDFKEANLSLRAVISMRDSREQEVSTGVAGKTHFLITSFTDTEGLKFKVAPFPLRIAKVLKDPSSLSEVAENANYDPKLLITKHIGLVFNELEDTECLTLVDVIIGGSCPSYGFE